MVMKFLRNGKEYTLMWRDQMPPEPILVADDGSTLPLDAEAEKELMGCM